MIFPVSGGSGTSPRTFRCGPGEAATSARGHTQGTLKGLFLDWLWNLVGDFEGWRSEIGGKLCHACRMLLVLKGYPHHDWWTYPKSKANKVIDLLPKGAALLSTSLLHDSCCTILHLVVELCVHQTNTADLFSLRVRELIFSFRPCHQVFSCPMLCCKGFCKELFPSLSMVPHGFPVQTMADTGRHVIFRNSQALEPRNSVAPPQRGALDDWPRGVFFFPWNNDEKT